MIDLFLFFYFSASKLTAIQAKAFETDLKLFWSKKLMQSYSKAQ
jgi:hypothetical protein